MGRFDKYLKKKDKFDEDAFQKAYKEMAQKQGLSLDPDDPEHYYDYRALYKETGKLEPDVTGHFPSKYKLEGHPRMIIGEEEEKAGWSQRTRGIGELPKYEAPKEEVKLGVEAEGSIKFGEEKKEEIYKPIDIGLYLKAPSTTEISQKQDILLKLENNFELLDSAISEDYKNWQEYNKQLDDLEQEIEIAPQQMQFKLINDYNRIRDIHNGLVDKIEVNTAQQKQIKQEYDSLRGTYDKDVMIYNKWAEAQNRKPKELEPYDIAQQFTTDEIAQQLKDKRYASQGEREDPTWGQMVYNSLKAGLNQANRNFWNIFRMLEMGKIELEDKIDDFFFPGTKDRKKKFEEKYGKDPDFSLPLEVLTKLVEDAEETEAFSAAQAESKDFLKQSVNIGLRPIPQIGMSVLMGAAIPGATGIGATKNWAEFLTAWKRMYPFGSLAGAGKAREIEKGYKALDEEAPYMKMLIGGTLEGLGEMATEMPVYMGVMKLFGLSGAGSIINRGAKTWIEKYGKAAYLSLSNIFLQGVQEGEMFVIGKSIDQFLGDPQDWSKEELIEGTWKDFYGGLCMGFITLGIGGGISGSRSIANKTKDALDNFINNKSDVRETMRKILEYQGIIMEEPKEEAFAYKAKIKPMGESFKEMMEERAEIAEAIKKQQPETIPVFEGTYKKHIVDGDLFYTRDNKHFLTEGEVAGLATPEFVKELLKTKPKAPYVATVYRGTKEGVAPVDEGLFGKGTYYSTNKEYAETYGKITTSEITLDNPFIIDSQEKADEFWNEVTKPARAKAIKEGKTPKEANEIAAVAAREFLEKKGFDGVVARDIIAPGDEVVVFKKQETPEEIEIREAREYKKLPEPNYQNLEKGQVLIDKSGAKWDILDITKEGVPAYWKYKIKRQDIDVTMDRPLGEIERYYKIKDVNMMVGGLFAKKIMPIAPETLKIFHLSTQKDLKNVDPEFMGTGQIGREKENIGKPGFEKTSAWYTEETPRVEPRFTNNMLYTAVVESKDIYDWKKNPDNLKTHTAIKEAGYKGYKIDDQVRLFEKVDVAREGNIIFGKGEKVPIKGIEKRVAPLKRVSDIVYDIAELHNKNSGTETEEMHGATYNLYDGDLVGKKKFSVGYYPELTEVTKGKEVTQKMIANFVKKNMDLLKNPSNSVGTWWRGESNEIALDIVRTIDSKEEALALGKEKNQEAIFDLYKMEEIPVPGFAKVEAEIPPVKPPVPPKKTAEKPEEGKPKKSLEEKLKDAQKEINRLKGIIKTIKGNVEKRAEFKKELVAYIKKNMPYPIQNKMLATVKNVTGDKALEQAMEKIDQYTLDYYKREYIKKITSELKAKKIEPKRTPSGMLKGKFVPAIQDKLDFIRANFDKPRANALNRIQENNELFFQGKAINIAEENELLNMVGIKEMDLETLQSTLENIKSLKKIGKTLKGIKDAANKERHEQDIIKTLEALTGKKVKIDEESGKAIIDSSYKTLPKTKWGRGLIDRARKAMDKIVNWQFGLDNLLDKLSALDRTSKPYQSNLSKIGDRVHYARIEYLARLEDVLNKTQVQFVRAYEATSKKEVLKITQQLREEINLGDFKNSEGDLVHLVLTKEQILKKYMQLSDPTLEKTFTDMLYTEEIKDAIRGAVSEKDLAWKEGAKEIYKYMWGRINPVFEEMCGIHFSNNPNYSGTIRRDVDIDIPEVTLVAQDAFRYASILNPSLKTRTQTKQSLKYDDMTHTLMNYVMQMEHFINWAKPLNDLRSVFGDKRVKSVIVELYGQNILDKINGFLDDMTRDGVDRSKIIGFVDKIRFNFSRAVLAKPHIGLKQIPSILAYMTEMSVTDFVRGINNFWKNPIKNYRYLVEHSPYAKERFGAGFERDIHGAMQSDYYHVLAKSHKISDLAMSLVRAGDKFAVMQGMWAKFYSETKGQTINAKNAKEAIAQATILTERTQPSFTVESLATGQRGGSFLKLFTMFQNQPNKYFRLIADNARNFKYGRGSRVKAASNIVLAWAILPMLFQLVGDAGKWIPKHHLRALILGPVNDILVFGAMMRDMYGWLIKEGFDVETSPVFSTMGEITNALAKIAKWIDPDRDMTPEDIQAFCEHFAKAIGQLMGLPTPYGVQVVKAVQQEDIRQLLFSEYILSQGEEKVKKKKPYVKSYGGDKYSKYLKSGYSNTDKYSKYLKKY